MAQRTLIEPTNSRRIGSDGLLSSLEVQHRAFALRPNCKFNVDADTARRFGYGYGRKLTSSSGCT